MSQAYPGARFIGATWRPGAEAGAIARLRGITSGWTLAEGPGWLVACDRADNFAESGATALALGRRHAFDRSTSAFPGVADIANALDRHGDDALSGMAPPFRAAWASKATGSVSAQTDAFGLGHLFLGSRDGISAVSSSATLLADILATTPSLEALAGFAMSGGFIGGETPFAGVTKLMAGCSAVLSDGKVSTSLTRAPHEPGVTATEAMRAAVAAMLTATPDAELELSGGLDSRIILAAMPAEARRGRRAITIGVASDPSDDIRVAKGLAASEGLDWSILDVGGIAHLDGPALAELLARAVAGYDHMANPIDKVALITAGGGRALEARFGGQNGEILRGFYYPSQPLDVAPSEALARRLISWRLTANDKVDDALLAPSLRNDLRADAEARMVTLLMSFGGTWGQTLDRFYLAQRMQNWVGNSVGNRLVGHVPLYPFFDPTFVAAAMSTEPSEKLNSRAAYRLLGELDMGLARQPLAGGIIPAALPGSGLASRFADLRLDVERVAGRVRRRLAGVGRPTLGSQTVTQQWRALGLNEQLPLDALARTGLFDVAGLERIRSGQWSPDRPTLGFLLLAAGLVTGR